MTHDVAGKVADKAGDAKEVVTEKAFWAKDAVGGKVR